MIDIFDSTNHLDKRAVDRYFMSEELLMEHAAIAMADEVALRFDSAKVLIVCGAGDNGGDGLAVARILDIYGYDVSVFLAYNPKSELAKKQLDRVKKLDIKIVNKIENCDVIVDAIFGSGLNRDLDKNVLDLIDRLNGLDGYKIACDIPSGIDKNGNFSVAFRADLTVTMGAAKLALYSDFAKDFVGEIVIADLGVIRSKYSEESDYKLLEQSDLMLPIRSNKNSHKGSHGHLAVVVGDKQGAGIISAMSGMRFGAGLTTVISKEKIVNLPFEIMQSDKLPQNINSVAIGMGLGESFSDSEIKNIIKDKKVVIDADILRKPIIKEILENQLDLIVTPHPKEFSELLAICDIGKFSVNEIQKDRFNLAKKFSEKYKNCVLLLKGANVIIAHNGKIFVNPHGSSVLAKGGSGDVLSGMIAALLAQGYSTLDAVVHASLAHAIASNNFAKNSYAMTPSDLIDLISVVEI